MVLQSPPLNPSSSSSSSPFCPCATSNPHLPHFPRPRRTTKHHKVSIFSYKNVKWALFQTQSCINGAATENPHPHFKFDPSTAGRAAKNLVFNRFSNNELQQVDDEEEVASSTSSSSYSNVNASSNTNASNYYSNNFGQQDPIVDKLRSQLGVIHPIPSPPINRGIFGLFAFFFFIGIVFDKLWTSSRDRITGRRTSSSGSENKGGGGSWGQVPSNLSMFLEKDLQRKESVEWVNMVLGKLWKVYRVGIENWITASMQPVIDNLKKPDYVQRVEIKQFSLGEEPLSVRSVERRTSRRVNDLQYQIGIRYTGGARMLLLLSLKFGILPIVVPVGVRDFDIDGELWVKLRLIPTEPWVGAVSWAFVSLPKIKFELSPFRLFNLMAIPVLSMFLTKLLTEDLPKLFVRPNKIVLDFQKGKAVGVKVDPKTEVAAPVPIDPKSGEIQEGNSNFAGELSATLLDARKLNYVFYGKTDPYVILRLGDQRIRSKRNSQTTVIGPPGEPIWNQDFHMLVANPMKEKLFIEVKDSLGFTDLTIGTAEVDLASLKDTVPSDRIVVLRGWSPFGKRSTGELLVRLTYKAYVEDEDDEKSSDNKEVSDNEMSDSDVPITSEKGAKEVYDITNESDKESLMNVLAALLVSEEFRGIVTSETINNNIKSVDKGSVGNNSTLKTDVASTEQTESGSSQGLLSNTLFWLAVITSTSVLIALNMGGSSLFNP